MHPTLPTTTDIARTPVLYKLGSTGLPVQWQGIVLTDGVQHFLCTEFGRVGGTIQRSALTPVASKHVGQANETTPEQQALRAMASKATAQLNDGYATECPAAGSVAPITGKGGRIKPMLAEEYGAQGHQLTFPALGQPKLDGVRALTRGTEFWSRDLNPFPAACVAHLQCAVPHGLVIDGELMLPAGGVVFEGTSSAVKKFDPVLSPQLRYYVFDLVDTTLPDAERQALLDQLFAEGAFPSTWVRVPTVAIATRDAVEPLLDQMIAHGFEGLMLRTRTGRYRPGIRTTSLQKHKRMIDAEFLITGVRQATGKDAGTAILVCETAAGKEFTARPLGTHAYRAGLWARRAELPGRRATIRFQHFMKSGAPRFPRGVAIRDYE